MKKVTMIRHAESLYNYHIESNDCDMDKDDIRFIDCGLTTAGIQQSENLDLEFDLLILSPLKRCIETFGVSKIRATKIITNDMFREYKTDICDFMKEEELVYEDEEDILRRTVDAKSYIMDLPYENIGIVTHSDFIWYFTSYETDGMRFGKDVDNAGFIQIDL